jgi:hypothetical protein
MHRFVPLTSIVPVPQGATTTVLKPPEPYSVVSSCAGADDARAMRSAVMSILIV